MPISPSRLAGIALFDGIHGSDLDILYQNARERTHAAGATIIYQEDPGNALYLITKGTVKISYTLLSGNEVYLALLAAGDTVGEMSLIDASCRSANVIALERTELIIIDREIFNRLLEDSPVFARNLMRILARRLRLANVRIQAHCALDTYGMVAFQLLEFAELYGEDVDGGSRYIPVRLTQGDISQLVGATRERVNKVMITYRKTGMLSVDKNYHITIHRATDLRKRAEQSS